MFFIRLPKCASTSFLYLLQDLEEYSDFYMEFNPSGAYDWKDDEKWSVAWKCLRRLMLKKKVVYARHFYFLDFTPFGLKNFTYVTVIRNPIDKVLSSYLYYHFSSKRGIQQLVQPEHKNESLSTCLQYEHEGCTHNLITKYFCGHEYWCKLGNEQALKTAKNNLRTNFALVGIMEDMELSMELMRQLLPQFFAVATENRTREVTLPAMNKNERTVSLSEEERGEIGRANAADVELYEYARRLLHDRARLCNIHHH